MLERRELIKIFFGDNNLDYNSQRKLESKINYDEITTEEELKKRIAEEKKKTEERITEKRKKESLKRELIKIVNDNNNLDNALK